ncbi:MAG TPA: histidine kinase [Cyclobacteriaceae bacterium]|nr:histidine kinase [Cyclobacteriaceae bacterium]
MFFKSNSAFDERVSVRAADFCEHIITEMGAELHDDLIQKLAAISFHIERIERASTEPAEILALVTRLRTDFETVTQTTRAISRRLNPVHMSGSTFESNIGYLCDIMQRPGNGQVICTSSGHEQPISQVAFTYLYRIIQELIHNAFKHSAAWKVEVRIVWTGNSLMVEVEDDGISHVNLDEVIAILQTKHNSMYMRSQAINASMKFSKGKKGLLVRIDFPIHHQ